MHSDVSTVSTIKTKAKAKASCHQGQGKGQGQCQNTTNKAYNANITLISVQLFAFIK